MEYAYLKKESLLAIRALALASSKPMPNAKLDDFTKNMLHWISQTQKWVTLTYSKCIGSFIYEVLLCTHLHIILVYFIYLPVTFRFPLSPFPPRVFSPHFSHFHFSQSLRLYTSNLRSHSILQRQEHSALHDLLLQRKPNHSGVSSTGFK
ncbi:hypothetical protein I3842_13G158200 [Carya illinoinensis]|uniref:Uncharacterized protein n=1 Tax=Carya illinoinensis TaxID=32201 RepID=A0A922DE62_CARIL|nr:hypothetical protein I3842_13G158200 [Carya illinoinensis]KAG6682743.1 hypothetical protein I3842_13G158200 [Carya illinoinensis]